MTWKTAIVRHPLRRGQGRHPHRPPPYSREELEDITLRFMYKLKSLIGPYIDIPAPDVDTNAEIMAMMMRQYTDGERERHTLRGVVTGKDVRIGGSEGRVKATGQGVVYCIEEWARERGAAAARGARHPAGLRQRGLGHAPRSCPRWAPASSR